MEQIVSIMCEFNPEQEFYTIWNLSWKQIKERFKLWQKYNFVVRAGKIFGFIEDNSEPETKKFRDITNKDMEIINQMQWGN